MDQRVGALEQKGVVLAVLERERQELENDDAFERQELANIYVNRGLDPSLAAQFMAHDALGTHARDELGLSET